jgi:hypothetical protein
MTASEPIELKKKGRLKITCVLPSGPGAVAMVNDIRLDKMFLLGQYVYLPERQKSP